MTDLERIQLADAITALTNAANWLERLRLARGGRAIAIAQTHAQTARLWAAEALAVERRLPPTIATPAPLLPNGEAHRA
jgi:hypothetical protein